MSFRQIQRSVLIAAGIAALAIAGLFAGRLSADAFPQGSRGDFAPRMFGRIARALDLTDDQKGQIKNALRSHASEIEAQMTAARTARQALAQSVLALPVDEATIRARATDVGKVHADGAVLFAKIRAEIDPILTPEQRDKVRTLHSRVRGHRDSAAHSLEKFLKSGS